MSARHPAAIASFVLDRAHVQDRHRDGDALMKNTDADGRRLYGVHFHEIVGQW